MTLQLLLLGEPQIHLGLCMLLSCLLLSRLLLLLLWLLMLLSCLAQLGGHAYALLEATKVGCLVQSGGLGRYSPESNVIGLLLHHPGRKVHAELGMGETGKMGVGRGGRGRKALRILGLLLDHEISSHLLVRLLLLMLHLHLVALCW
jgi:hypothetical protein